MLRTLSQFRRTDTAPTESPAADGLPQSTIHFVLSSDRRRDVLRYLERSGGRTSIRALSEYVATNETGVAPAPRKVRETVYVSLIQTHLPALADLGVIHYDRANREVVSLDASRDLRVYMEVVTRFGITWDEYYRYLGVLGLLTVVAIEVGVPGLAAVDPLLTATGFLAAFALSTIYQFRRQWRPFLGSLPGLVSRTLSRVREENM